MLSAQIGAVHGLAQTGVFNSIKICVISHNGAVAMIQVVTALFYYAL